MSHAIYCQKYTDYGIKLNVRVDRYTGRKVDRLKVPPSKQFRKRQRESHLNRHIK